MSDREREVKGNDLHSKNESREEEREVSVEGCETSSDDAATSRPEAMAGEEGTSGEESYEELVERLKKENEELRNRILYLHAEMDNFRKRAAREKEQLIAYGNEKLIRELITVLDHLELAISHGEEDEKIRKYLSGVEMTYNEFLNILKKFGVEQIDDQGGKFDPTVHEAVSSIPAEGKEPGTIYQVVRKGYMLNGRLIRPVQVVVVREPEKGDGEEKPGEEKVN